MKKILVLSLTLLVVLAGCASKSPEESYKESASSIVENNSNIDYTLATVIVTEDGDYAYDNIGVITQDESSVALDVKFKLDSSYVDANVYSEEDTVYLNIADDKTKMDIVSFLANYPVANFANVDGLLPLTTEGSEASQSGDVHTYTFTGEDLETFLKFSMSGELNEMNLLSGSFTQKVTLDKNAITKNDVFLDMVFADKDGVEYPVTQNMSFKYSKASNIEKPELTEFK